MSAKQLVAMLKEEFHVGTTTTIVNAWLKEQVNNAEMPQLDKNGLQQHTTEMREWLRQAPMNDIQLIRKLQETHNATTSRALMLKWLTFNRRTLHCEEVYAHNLPSDLLWSALAHNPNCNVENLHAAMEAGANVYCQSHVLQQWLKSAQKQQRNARAILDAWEEENRATYAAKAFGDHHHDGR